MTEGVIIAMITAGLSLVGVIITVYSGNKKTQQTIQAQTDLTLYRIARLEEKQDKHNGVIERMYNVEQDIALLKEKVRVENHRIDDLEQFHKPQ